MPSAFLTVAANATDRAYLTTVDLWPQATIARVAPWGTATLPFGSIWMRQHTAPVSRRAQRRSDAFCNFISLPTAPEVGLLVGNPFAKVGRTIHELASVPFAKSEKRNGTSIRKDHLLQDSYVVPSQVTAHTRH